MKISQTVWLAILCGSNLDAATITLGSVLTGSDTVISQSSDLGTNGSGNLDSSSNYSDNGGPPGQTFTVTSDLLFTSFTVLGKGGVGGGAGTWGIQIGSVNTTTGAITALGNETGTANATDPNYGSSYLTFTLDAPIVLTAGGVYSFSLYTTNGYYGLARSQTNLYGGGTAFNNNISTNEVQSTTGNDPTGARRRNFNGGFVDVAGSYDYVFAINGTVIPEPSTTGLAVLAFSCCCVLRRRK